jgi:diaminopimelate epimerase
MQRGEGWTRSSGSSATAVASAARHLGLVTAPTVYVKFPGGSLPVRFEEGSGQVEYFGVATLCDPRL